MRAPVLDAELAESTSGNSEPVRLPASVLHDLRTPLNQIIGYSELLVEQAEDDGLAVFVPDLQKIRFSGRQLLDKINVTFYAANTDEVNDHTMSKPSNRESIASDKPTDRLTTNNIKIGVSANSMPGLVLVVDDVQQNREVLSKRLIRLGHSVIAVASGAEAHVVLRSQPFDLILLDIMMPDVDGFEVLRQLKSDPAVLDIPVVMISALNAVDDIARCIELGADDYLSKPFDAILLKARVGACLDKKRAHDREKVLFDQVRQNFEDLKTLEKQRDDLTHMIIHDLRTPLTSMIGGLKSLGLVGELTSEQQEMMDISISGGDMLLGMINDLLDVEKLSLGVMTLDLVSVSLPELIASAVEQISNLADDKQLIVAVDVSVNLPVITVDHDKLRRVLVNLLGNAIKFTPPGGSVTVSAKWESENKSVTISVADTGEGIPAEALETIFEKFAQVATRHGGRTMSTGLGLAFCKLAVEAHGGHISAGSDIDSGSVFTLTLPGCEATSGIVRDFQ